MAMLGRKEPATQPNAEPRTRTRPATTAVEQDNSRTGRLRTNINNVVSELRKVTWPTREETRNLTIVVIGITVAIGGALGILDYLLNVVYAALAGTQ